MNSSIFIRIALFRTLLLIFMIPLIVSCSLDQIEVHYPNYEEALADNLFNKGWIPEQIISSSMSEIYLRNNIDINTCIFSFVIQEQEIKALVGNLTPGCSDINNVKGINIPSTWKNKIPQLDQYNFFDYSTSDTIHLAIDNKENRIYGWRD